MLIIFLWDTLGGEGFLITTGYKKCLYFALLLINPSKISKIRRMRYLCSVWQYVDLR